MIVLAAHRLRSVGGDSNHKNEVNMGENVRGYFCSRIDGVWSLTVYYHDGEETSFVHKPGSNGPDFQAFASAISKMRL